MDIKTGKPYRAVFRLSRGRSPMFKLLDDKDRPIGSWGEVTAAGKMKAKVSGKTIARSQKAEMFYGTIVFPARSGQGDQRTKAMTPKIFTLK